MASTSKFSRNDVVVSFDMYDHKLADEDLILRLTDICNGKLRKSSANIGFIKPPSLAAKWDLFHDGPPTAKLMDDFEIDVQKSAAANAKKQRGQQQQQRQQSSKKKTIHNKNSIGFLKPSSQKPSLARGLSETWGLAGGASTASQSSTQAAGMMTPVGSKRKAPQTPGSTGSQMGSPVYMSPATQKFANRTNSRDHVLPPLNENIAPKRRRHDDTADPVEFQVVRGRDQPDGGDFRRMDEQLDDVAAALDSRIRRIGGRVMARINRKVLAASQGKPDKQEVHDKIELQPVTTTGPTPFYVCGRVQADNEKKGNKKSLVLEGSLADSAGLRVRLNVDQVKQNNCLLFPGQVIVARGTAHSGQDVFNAEYIDSDARLASMSRDSLRRSQRPVTVMFAAGPFTTNDTVEYDASPLEELVQEVRSVIPDVLILAGPFVDENNKKVLAGDFDESFESVRDRMLASVANNLADLPQVLIKLLPSLNDISLGPAVYPQSTASLPSLPSPRLSWLPNPCQFRVNDVSFAVQSPDIIFLNRDQVTFPNKKPAAATRFPMIADQIIQQQSFFPFYPAPRISMPGVNVNVDQSHEDLFRLAHTPDILIQPSSCGSKFHTVIKQTVVVNPGRLAKGESGDAYAVITVAPSNPDKPQSVTDRTRVEIIRI